MTIGTLTLTPDQAARIRELIEFVDGQVEYMEGYQQADPNQIHIAREGVHVLKDILYDHGGY
jgi:hypothetical protein